MKLLNIHINAWYKTIHIVFACAWFGSVLAVVLIYLFTKDLTEEATIISNNLMIEKIDHWIIIPSSTLCFFSGLLISWKTNWGFFKYKWVLTKLILGSVLILFGIFFLGPWILQGDATLAEGIEPYQALQNKLGISMMVQAFFILFLIIVSSTKPWGKTK